MPSQQIVVVRKAHSSKDLQTYLNATRGEEFPREQTLNRQNNIKTIPSLSITKAFFSLTLSQSSDKPSEVAQAYPVLAINKNSAKPKHLPSQAETDKCLACDSDLPAIQLTLVKNEDLRCTLNTKT